MGSGKESHWEIWVYTETGIVKTAFSSEAGARVAFKLANSPAVLVEIFVVEEK